MGSAQRARRAPQLARSVLRKSARMMRDVLYGLRYLGRHSLLAASCVLIVGLGIGANAAILSIADTLYFRAPSRVLDARHVARLYFTVHPEGSGTPTTSSAASFPGFADLLRSADAFPEMAAYFTATLTLGEQEGPQAVTASLVSPTYFHLLRIPAFLGRPLGVGDNDSHLAVLRYGYWAQRFGSDSSILGRTIRIGRGTFLVVGVMAPDFDGVDLRPIDVWLPLASGTRDLFGTERLTSRNTYWLRLIARLAPGTAWQAAQSEVTQAFRESQSISPHGDPAAVVELVPLSQAHGPEGHIQARRMSWLVLISVILLVLACGNAGGLLLTSQLSREREWGIRMALGARKVDVLRIQLVQACLIGTAGGLCAILMAHWVGPVLRLTMIPELPRDAQILGPHVLLAVVLLVLLSIAFVFAITATHFGSANVLSSLREWTGLVGSTKAQVRRILVTVQVAFTVTLAINTAIILRSLQRVLSIPLGFNPSGLLSVSADLASAGYRMAAANDAYATMLDRVLRLPVVQSASLTIGTPFSAFITAAVSSSGGSRGRTATEPVSIQAVSPNYLTMMATRIIRGRPFSEGDAVSAAPVAVVNRTLARRLWPELDPIGQCLQFRSAGTCATVIGVAENVRSQGLLEDAPPQVYVPLPQASQAIPFPIPVTSVIVKVKSNSATDIDQVRAAAQAALPNLPYVSAIPLSSLIDAQLKPWQMAATAASSYFILAMLLASAGIVGLVGQSVTQRAPEIGIRLALGATPPEAVRVVIGRTLSILAVGVGSGIVGAVAASRLTSVMVYGASGFDARVWVVVPLLVYAQAALSAFFPARRAARIDPAMSLRME